jgi:hypothetical protein
MMRRLGIAALAVLALGVAGCGGSGGNSSTNTQPSTPATAQTPWASCPSAHEGYVLGKDMIQSGREGVAEGKEIGASEGLIRTGKKTIRLSIERCGLERENKATEASLCSHTPAEMAAMLREEGSRSAYEAAGAYEAACGKRVPNP